MSKQQSVGSGLIESSSSKPVSTVPPKRNVSLTRASRFARDGVMAD